MMFAYLRVNYDSVPLIFYSQSFILWVLESQKFILFAVLRLTVKFQKNCLFFWLLKFLKPCFNLSIDIKSKYLGNIFLLRCNLYSLLPLIDNSCKKATYTLIISLGGILPRFSIKLSLTCLQVYSSNLFFLFYSSSWYSLSAYYFSLTTP